MKKMEEEETDLERVEPRVGVDPERPVRDVRRAASDAADRNVRAAGRRVRGGARGVREERVLQRRGTLLHRLPKEDAAPRTGAAGMGKTARDPPPTCSMRILENSHRRAPAPLRTSVKSSAT